MKKSLLLPLLFLLLGCAGSKRLMPVASTPNPAPTLIDQAYLPALLASHSDVFGSLEDLRSKWQVKIIYTRIDRDSLNRPSFTDFYFNIDSAQYFYPASTVKMPGALLALQKLHQLGIKGLDRSSTMVTETAYPGQTAVYNDPTAPDGRPTIEHYIRKIFLVSDNDAFNRLYEFLGQEYINNTLHQMGYDRIQILHRLNISLPEDQNRATNPVLFYDSSSRIIYQQPLVKSKLKYLSRSDFMGRGYYSATGLVEKPFDFSKKNRFPLPDLHQMLKSVIFPASVPARQRFDLNTDDYQLVYRYMSMSPRESRFPSYDSTYPDGYSKLLFYGGKGSLDPGIRIFNKEGDAYGFLSDASYFVDFTHGVEFLLTANIYCNSDGIFNDDNYDYDSIGYPFLKNLGRLIYEEELKRPKKFMPDLSAFKFDYSR